MKSKLLLPHAWKTIGWLILIPTTIAGIILATTGFEADWLNARVFAAFHDNILISPPDGKRESGPFSIIETNITSTVIGILFIISAMMVSFSKEKVEDEFIANLRLSSLMWSVWVNYVLLLLAFLFVYGLSFFNVMIYNMFTVLIIFIIRFNYLLLRNRNALADEK
jgi:hypothetical protein